ncbi:MAG: hypothetical protein CL489_07200 [Acidobacteria bacterium]|nr:hypothetical protein [Acidobacteriota bacterium]|tara:strand:+ start:509 stop:1573 length:1065 start_codon:yes stop_codon:yes gene_type:complete
MIAEDRRGPDRSARFLILAASLVVVLAGLRAAGQLLLPFLVSVLLAIISLPFMAWLRRKGAPTVLAVLVTVLTAVAVLAGVVIVVGRSLNEFTAAAPDYQARFQQLMGWALEWFEARGVETAGWGAPAILNPGALMDLVGGTLRAVAAIAQNTFLVILTMVFILAEAAGFSGKLKAAFGDRSDHFERFGKMTRQIQRYLAIKTLISLATGILVGLWVSVLGLGFPLLWGLVAFIFNYIPNLGSILAAIPPVLLALVQFGPARAAVVAVGYLVINIGLANFLEPYLMGRRLGLSTLVVFLSLVFWGWVWGPVGMLLSVPLTVIVKIALENTKDFRWVAIMLGANPTRSTPRFVRH